MSEMSYNCTNTFHHSTFPRPRSHFSHTTHPHFLKASRGDTTCGNHTHTCTHTIHLHAVPVAHKSSALSIATRTRPTHSKTSHSRYLTRDGQNLNPLGGVRGGGMLGSEQAKCFNSMHCAIP